MKRRMSITPLGIAAISGVVALSACAPSWASLVADGLTYTLLQSTISSTEDQFTLDITGINAPGPSGDTEGGRFGVSAIAFNQPNPVGSVQSGSLPGFTFSMGGLNSSGCNMKGDFFCFQNNSTPSSTLPANSQLQFTFDVTLANGDTFSGYAPGFKIQWAGTKNSYDLVSKTLTPTPVPLPATLPLLFGAMAGLGFMSRRKVA